MTSPAQGTSRWPQSLPQCSHLVRSNPNNTRPHLEQNHNALPNQASSTLPNQESTPLPVLKSIPFPVQGSIPLPVQEKSPLLVQQEKDGHRERSEGSAVDCAPSACSQASPADNPSLIREQSVPREQSLIGEQRVTKEQSVTDTLHSLYKASLSPLLHTFGLTGGCRFQPTCSEYAALAFAQHGPARGLWLTLARLLRCQPLARGGWDPVPPAPSPRSSRTLEDPPTGTIEKPHSTNDPA